MQEEYRQFVEGAKEGVSGRARVSGSGKKLRRNAKRWCEAVRMTQRPSLRAGEIVGNQRRPRLPKGLRQHHYTSVHPLPPSFGLLDNFASFDRMSVDPMDSIRAVSEPRAKSSTLMVSTQRARAMSQRRRACVILEGLSR